MKKGWKIKKIGDLCELTTGGTPSRSKPEYFHHGKIKWLVSGDIHQKEIFDCEGRITEDGLTNSNARYLPVNSVLMALSGQGKTRGTVALLRTEATCNQSLVSIYPNDVSELMPEFLYHNLNDRYEEIRKITGDDNKDRRGLNMPLIRNIEIPLPPLPEQKRIVSVLDEAFSSIAKAKSNAERNLVNARELFESVLEKVFSNSNFTNSTLGDVAEIISGYGFNSRDFSPNNSIKSIKITNVGVREFVEESDNLLPSSFQSEYKKVLVKEADIVIALTRSVIANGLKVAIVPKSYDKSLLNQRVAALRAKNNIVLNSFLYLFLCSERVADYVRKQANTLMQPNLSITDLHNLPIPLPPLVEQRAIVGRLEALSAETKRLEEIYQSKVDALDELKKSVLGKAFAGEL